MFRFTRGVFNVVTGVVKQQKHMSSMCLKKQNRTTLIQLPYTAFFSTEPPKQEPAVKSPLCNLIEDKESRSKEKKSTEDEEDRKARETSWRTMKYTLVVFGVTFVFIGGYLIIELGKPPVDDYGNPKKDEFSDMPLIKQYVLRTLRELDFYRKLLKEPSRDKLLPDPLRYPYYQPPYTLVLEFTDVLVHPEWTYRTGWRFKKRPGVDQFLEALSGDYEIVVYTAEQGMTVFPILDALDPKNLISYKLVRDTTNFVDGHHVKDINKLNRDLKRVIVVDWNSDSVKLNPENMLRVPRWDGSDDDTGLYDLAALLKTIVVLGVDDVREVMKHYAEFDDPLAKFREKQREMQEQEYLDKKMRPLLQHKSWLYRFFGQPPA